jgi:transcriptional regulator with XRE-family HTH domain
MHVLSDTLRTARRKAGLTEIQAAARMGISQSYLAMLERGQRRVTEPLVRKFGQLYQLSPALLPLPETYTPNPGVDAQSLAIQLASLDYPGFAYFGQERSELHPARILLDGLAHEELEARMVEALPWLLIRYWEMDLVWLIRQAKLSDLQNRLGFTATLARRALENSAVPNAERDAALNTLESDLARSRLAKEDTFMKRVNEQEREWLRESRSQEARFWNILTDWRPEHLSYAR